MQLPATRKKLRAFTETIGAAKNDNDETTRNDRRSAILVADMGLPLGGENQAIPGAGGASRLHPIDSIAAEQFVRVSQHITDLLAASIEGNLALLLGDVKAKTRLAYSVPGQPHHVGGRRVRKRARRRVDAMRINEVRAFHPERFGERIHLADKNRDRCPVPGGGNDGLERTSYVVCQNVGCDVIRLDESCVKKVAQRDSVARLEANEIIARAGKRLGRNRRHLIQVARMFLRPVEDNHGCRDFGEAANLGFLSWFLLIQDKPGLGIHDREGACSMKAMRGRQPEDERKKSEEKTGWTNHESVKPLHLSRRSLLGNRQSGAMLDSARLGGRVALLTGARIALRP